MLLNETMMKIKGYFKLEVLDRTSNKVLETYEQNNLIMDLARDAVMKTIGGFQSSKINKIVFGTKGETLGVPKTFNSTRTNIFSEELSSFKYSINFEPTTNGSYANITEDDVGAGSTVKVTTSGTTLTYNIELAPDAANNGSLVQYSEAALYCGLYIFSMKTFGISTKDSSVKFKITWSITF